MPSRPFDERKLVKLIEKRQQNFVLLRDLGERKRAALNTRNRIQSRVDQERMHGRVPGAATLRELVAAQARLKELIEEHDLLAARVGPQNAVAARCEEWARAQGWNPDGRLPLPGRSVSPQVHGTVVG